MGEEVVEEMMGAIPRHNSHGAENTGARSTAGTPKLHQCLLILLKVESSSAIQLRTEKIGFAIFLHARRVLDALSLACQCS